MSIKVKHINDQPDKGDGIRILVEAFLPGGLDGYKTLSDLWPRELAPSERLVRMLKSTHKWEDFKKAYFKELDERDIWISTILQIARGGNITLLHCSDDPDKNNAAVIREYMLAKLEQEKELLQKAA